MINDSRIKPQASGFYTSEDITGIGQYFSEKYKDRFKIKKVNESTQGRPIWLWSFGEGMPVFCYSYLAADQPIGASVLVQLTENILSGKNPLSKEKIQWLVMPCADPDGVDLNNGWIKDTLSVKNYLLERYCPLYNAPNWSFPVKYKEISFISPPKETEAVAKIIDEYKPSFIYSGFYSTFGSACVNLSDPLPKAHSNLLALYRQAGLEIEQKTSAPEVRIWEQGIFDWGGAKKTYDYFIERGYDPKILIRGGTSAAEYAKEKCSCLLLTGEIPLFTYLKDYGQAAHDTERDVRLIDLSKTLELMKYIESIMPVILHKADKGPFLDRAVEALEISRKNASLKKKRLEEAPEYLVNISAERAKGIIMDGNLTRARWLTYIWKVVYKNPHLKKIEGQVTDKLDNIIKDEDFSAFPIEKSIDIQMKMLKYCIDEVIQ